jgi:hypothetical protein
MASYKMQIQRIVDQYLEAGQAWPATTRQIAAWAIGRGLWKPEPSKVVDQFAREIAEAMREEYITDPQGRTVRAKHAARIKLNDGEQMVLWADIRTASKTHMEIALQQRRQQIVGDCRQLKLDADSYNQNQNQDSPIELVFNFELDLEELEIQNLARLN